MKAAKPLQIEDLHDSLELDQAAMQSIVGGSARSFLLAPSTGSLVAGLAVSRPRQRLAQSPFARFVEGATLDQ